MASNTCSQDTKIYNTFELKHLSVPARSNARDGLSRLELVAKGKELLARGQESTPANADAVKEVRKLLNKAIADCDKLDEENPVFDKKLEQRVALFQKRHLAGEKGLAGEKEIDGVVGEKTLRKLKDMARGVTSSTSEGPEAKVQSELRSEEEIKLEQTKREEIMRRRAALPKGVLF